MYGQYSTSTSIPLLNLTFALPFAMTLILSHSPRNISSEYYRTPSHGPSAHPQNASCPIESNSISSSIFIPRFDILPSIIVLLSSKTPHPKTYFEVFPFPTAISFPDSHSSRSNRKALVVPASIRSSVCFLVIEPLSDT